MPRPLVYADECIDLPTVEVLRSRGFDVLTTSEAGYVGHSDREQLRHSLELGRPFITYNKSHFERLHSELANVGEPHQPVLVIPQSVTAVVRGLRLAMMLDWISATHEAEGSSHLLQWNDLQLGLQRGVRLNGYSEAEVRQALTLEDRPRTGNSRL